MRSASITAPRARALRRARRPIRARWEDTTGYTPDESEYNDINTDRELFALRAVSKSLEKITEKKSLLYFSGGISRDGIENQASLRAAVNAAVRANLASTAWTRGASRRLARLAMHRREACVAAPVSTARRSPPT